MTKSFEHRRQRIIPREQLGCPGRRGHVRPVGAGGRFLRMETVGRSPWILVQKDIKVWEDFFWGHSKQGIERQNRE